MKIRFNTYDIVCSITELQQCIGLRVDNIYDIDSKTYLIRLKEGEKKGVLLIESGNRFHLTNFEWPKNVVPSGFSMKMRKHLKNKRLIYLKQLGSDRIIDLQFGSNEAAYHIILELYDKGNIILTDCELTILNILRPHTEGDRFKFVVREKYPELRARENNSLSKEMLEAILKKANTGDQLKKVLVSNLDYGPAVLEHVLLKQGFVNSTKIGKSFSIDKDIDKLLDALKEADLMFENAKKNISKGFIIQKKEERIKSDNDVEYFFSNQDFQPFLFEQCKKSSYKEFDTFNSAVDEFYSSMESQKLELRAFQKEREALKKLENVKKDHSQRLSQLEKNQQIDIQKAELISRNQILVDQAILAIQTALANQLSWPDIEDLVRNAAEKGEILAKHIHELKLQTNTMTLNLSDPYEDSNSDDEDDKDNKIPTMLVDIDLGLSAFSNARKYYDLKRSAAKKQQKTFESQSKALKSAEKKTKQTLKDVQIVTSIIKARKVYWFEKFFWFISSENYLIIGGRDQQQNELIVKKYMRPKDIYVHADIHGASSIIIKNPSGQSVPPKTLNEAGTMAICYSVAWEAKVVTNAYWVWGEQVSKTAPTGEYITTGSFMIRGKKNFFPLSHLVLGLSFLFKLEEHSIERHKNERRLLSQQDIIENSEIDLNTIDEEIEIPDDNEDETSEKKDRSDKSDTDDSDTDRKFPNTQVKIQHFSGTKINIITENNDKINVSDDEVKGEKIIYLGDNKPVIVKNKCVSRKTSESKVRIQCENVEDEKPDTNNSIKTQLKRGQKSKIKKMKEKYKDQDEEERKIKMDILKSDGSQKINKKQNKKSKNILNPDQKIKKPRPPLLQPKQNNTDIVEDVDEPVVQAEVDMIDSLTGIPHPEDELLFAVPVIAPYTTLTNYKFKVKLTPGNSKRGKAAKTALNIFMKDKSTTSREKDLLKAVKDEQLARNIPGKVKLSAPKLLTLKK